MSNYLYVNYTKVAGNYLSKVGISNNPEKRLREFNLGVKYRTSFKNSPVFKRFFTIKIQNRAVLKQIESDILSQYKSLIDPFYGREVLNINPEYISKRVNDLVCEVCHD